MKYEYLNKDEEYELIEAYQNGDESALTKLIEFNQLNVSMVVGKFYHPYDGSYNDAIQEGNIALMKAIKKFDTSTGNRLISYANRVIINDIYKNVYLKHKTIKLNDRAIREMNKCKEGEEPLSEGYRIASRYNFTPYDIDEHYDDECFGYEQKTLENKEVKNVISELINQLPDETKFIIEHRFNINDKPFLKLEDIGRFICNDGKYRTVGAYRQLGKNRVDRGIEKLKKLADKNNIKLEDYL
ncbi:sigma-70 family RNA polymerase sigma factor [Psychroserpens mesophilus]|uniref:sigma-70 family RNA polymerase sigma factor n=1 Tax=Psychroserpens mesophilus TaxID=325473 RepID=UPI003D64938D